MTYLEDAAAELAKAREANDKLAVIAAENAKAGRAYTDLLRDTADRSVAIADGFIRIAAIGASREETP